LALVPDSGNQKPPKGLAAFAGGLDGEGVCEFFHSGLQILDLTLLLFHEQIFYPITFGPYLGAQIHHLGTRLLDILPSLAVVLSLSLIISASLSMVILSCAMPPA
jgi:hypothetical protein